MEKNQRRKELRKELKKNDERGKSGRIEPDADKGREENAETTKKKTPKVIADSGTEIAKRGGKKLNRAKKADEN